MLDDTLNSKIDFYNQPRFVENPHHPAGFTGTFAFNSIEFAGFRLRTLMQL